MNVSQLGTWLKCRYLWNKVYVEGVIPRRERPAISLGDAVHRTIAPFLAGEAPEVGLDDWTNEFDKLGLTEEEERIRDITREVAWKIFDRTRDEIDLGHKWETALDQDSKPLVEYHFRLEQPVGRYEGFQGSTDWIGIEMVNGRQWLVDWKVRKTFMPIDAEEFSLQMASYTKMVKARGFNPIGSMGWQLKSAAARKPKENKPKKGVRSLSKAAILTDWSTYAQAVLDIGGNPNDYLDMKSKLADVEWSRQSRCYWPEKTIENLWTETIRNTGDVGEGNFPRNMNHLNCKPCRLKDLCQADLRGDDVEFLMRTQFMLRTDKVSPLPILVDDEQDDEIDTSDVKPEEMEE